MEFTTKQMGQTFTSLTVPETPKYQNPTPVAVALVPVHAIDPNDGVLKMGLLVGRRGIEPKLGAFALPGGYIEYEDWRDAVCREVVEETGIRIPNPSTIKLVGVESVDQMKQLVIFGEVDCISEVDLHSFSATAECQEIKVIFSPENLAFDSHNKMVIDFFERRRINSGTREVSEQGVI